MAITQHELKIWRGTAVEYAAFVSNKTVDPDTLYYVAPADGDLTGMCYRGANPMGMRYRAVTAFPTKNIEQGVLYLGPAGEAKFYSGTDWIQVCYPLVDTVTENDKAVPSAKAVFTYVNTFAAGLGRLLPAVQSVANLSGISGAMDKDLILVEDSGALYRFDAQSTDTADGDKIVGTGSGRWIKMITATNMTEGNGIKIENNVVSVDYNTTVFTVDENGKITMNPIYIKGITDSITDAQTDATQALSDAADAQATADGKITKISGATGGKIATTTKGGELSETSYTIGGVELDKVVGNRGTTLATEAAVADAVSNANAVVNGAKMDKLTDATAAGKLLTVNADGQAISANVTAGGSTLATTPTASVLATEAAVADVASGKMDKIDDPTAGNLVGMDTNGNSTDSGKTVGGAKLATTPTDTVLATEAAVAAAVAAAKIYWLEGTGDLES